MHSSQLILHMAEQVADSFIMKELFNKKTYLGLILPDVPGVFIHPDTARKIARNKVLSKLLPALNATKKIANRPTHCTTTPLKFTPNEKPRLSPIPSLAHFLNFPKKHPQEK